MHLLRLQCCIPCCTLNFGSKQGAVSTQLASISCQAMPVIRCIGNAIQCHQQFAVQEQSLQYNAAETAACWAVASAAAAPGQLPGWSSPAPIGDAPHSGSKVGVRVQCVARGVLIPAAQHSHNSQLRLILLGTQGCARTCSITAAAAGGSCTSAL